MVLVRSNQLYYPQQKDPRLNEDLRIAYDHIYTMQSHLSNLSSKLEETNKSLKDAHSKIAAQPEPGGPSNTRITGIAVKGVPPRQGNAVANLSGIPVLGYNADSGQFEFYIT